VAGFGISLKPSDYNIKFYIVHVGLKTPIRESVRISVETQATLTDSLSWFRFYT
jgi:hypothetical protein